MLLLLLINIIFSHNISLQEYGTYQAVWTFINICVVITSFGLPRYILSFGGTEKYKPHTFSKVFGVVFLLLLLPILIYFTWYAEGFTAANKLWMLLLLLLQTIYIIQEANTISARQNKHLIVSNAVYALSLFILHLLILYGTGYNLNHCIIAIAFSTFLRNSMLWLLMKSYRKESLHLQAKKVIDRMQLLWFGLNDSLQVISKWLDKIVLLFFLPAADYAIYFNGTYEIPLIGLGLTVFQTVITTESAVLNDDDKQVTLFNRSTLFMSAFLFPLFALCVCYPQQIIRLLFSSAYQESAILFAITSLLLPLRIANYTVLLQLKKKGGNIFIGSLIDLGIAIILMLVLYPVLKLPGLALAMVLATVVQIIYLLYMTCKAYHTSIFTLIPFKPLLMQMLKVTVGFLFIKITMGYISELAGFAIACAFMVGYIIYRLRYSKDAGSFLHTTAEKYSLAKNKDV